MNVDKMQSVRPGSDVPPLVTVVVLTYNHETFIEQAVLSVLAQRTSFPIDVLIGEDCSTDRTREILRRLDATNPGRMTLLFREQNLGLSRNLQDCRERVRGKYMAILEGDDYWIDSGKLQKTADAMEAHPDWSMVFHSARNFYDDGTADDLIAPVNPPAAPLGVPELLLENRVPTHSVSMFRQGLIERTPDWHVKLRIGDWALNILHADRGPIGFLPDVMTAYRVHRGGLWSGCDTAERWQQFLLLCDSLEEYFQGRYSAEIAASRRKFFTDLQREFDELPNLRKIQRRYFALRLDKIAGVLRWFRITWDAARKRMTGG